MHNEWHLSLDQPRVATGEETTMKLISSSIVVLSGAILLVGGSHARDVDTQLFVMIVGCGVGLLGFWGWFAAFNEKQP